MYVRQCTQYIYSPFQFISFSTCTEKKVCQKTTDDASSTNAATAGQSIKKGRTSRRCHNCKTYSVQHRVCNYWNLDGTKCKKIYCLSCLTNQYTVGDDVKSKSNPKGLSIKEIVSNPKLDREWHCPSCLVTCMCNSCVTQRKRDEEREKNRVEGERKSSRQSKGNLMFSHFF